MGDLKSFIANYRSVHRLVPFLPEDNQQESVEHTLAYKNNMDSIKLLLKSNFLVYISEMARNQSLQAFLDSYLACRSKPYSQTMQLASLPKPSVAGSANNTAARALRQLDSKVFLLILRLVSPRDEEYDRLAELLPQQKLTVVAAGTAGKSGAGGKKSTGVLNAGSGESNLGEKDESGASADDAAAQSEARRLKRRTELKEAYQTILQTHVSSLIRCPSLMDLLSILGDSNAHNPRVGGTLLKRVNTVQMSASSDNLFLRDIGNTFKEAICTIEQVQLAVIVLYGKINNRLKSGNGCTTTASNTLKVSNVSVLSGGVTSSQSTAPTATTASTASEEWLYLTRFLADIIYTLDCFVAGLSAADLLRNNSSLFCLDGTHLTGYRGLKLVRILQNVYEVCLPVLFSMTHSILQLPPVSTAPNSNTDMKDAMMQQRGQYLGLIQSKCLQLLHSLIVQTQEALQPQQQVPIPAAADSMDVLREDGVDWISVFHQSDALGNDILSLTAIDSTTTVTKPKRGISSDRGGGGGGAKITVHESEVIRGALLSDYIKVYGDNLVRAILCAANNDEHFAYKLQQNNAEYVIQSLKVKETIVSTQEEVAARVNESQLSQNSFQQQLDKATISSSTTSAASAGGGYDGAISTTGASNLNLEESIANIKSIFPDLGEGFIEACLSAYQGNVEEIIEALLMDNLNPKLLLLDRSLQRMWIGKGGKDSDSKISMNAQGSNEKGYQAVDDAKFKTIQKQRIREMEKQQEYDHMLLQREYNDDYDDQYDDAVDMLKARPVFDTGSLQPSLPHRTLPLPPSAAVGGTGAGAGAITTGSSSHAQLSESLQSRRERRKANKTGGVSLTNTATTGAVTTASTTAAAKKAPGATSNTAVMSRDAIHQQMADVKRANALAREAEVEDAYWESMRNTNHTSSRGRGGKDQWKKELADIANAEAEAIAGVPPTAGSLNTNTKADTNPGAKSGTSTAINTGTTQNRNPSNKKGPGGKGGNNKGATSNSAAGGGQGESATGDEANQKKKFRTKMYDKHRQKDRATRKSSQFTPTS